MDTMGFSISLHHQSLVVDCVLFACGYFWVYRRFSKEEFIDGNRVYQNFDHLRDGDCSVALKMGSLRLGDLGTSWLIEKSYTWPRDMGFSLSSQPFGSEWEDWPL